MIPLFFSILPLCVIPIQETPKEIQNFVHCLNSEKKIEQVIEWEPLISKYFKEEDRAEALLIVYCESRGKPTAVGTPVRPKTAIQQAKKVTGRRRLPTGMDIPKTTTRRTRRSSRPGNAGPMQRRARR